MSANRPESPGSASVQKSNLSPSELDPDLQALEMAKNLLKDLDTPSDISKEFAVRKAIYTALNNTDENQTGYDASLRVALYASYERSSLNIGAKLFNSFMAFLMKPKMIIQGLPTATQQANEPGFISRMLSRLRGQEPQTNGATQQ